MSFVKRRISVIFSYGTGNNGEGAPEIIQLDGHRVSVSAAIAGRMSMGQMQLRIMGLPQSTMNKLSTIGKLPHLIRKNFVQVMAGDEGKPLATVYRGSIIAAWADMAGAPDVAFNVTAVTGYYESLVPSKPLEVPDDADVSALLSKLASDMGFAFEDNDVNVKLPKGYYPGSPREQVISLIKAANLEWNGFDNGVLAIWRKGSYRSKQPVIDVSPQTGLVGYPSYTQMGLMLNTLYNPDIRYGSKIHLTSSLPQACGDWGVISVSHELEAETPNGKWFSTLQVVPVGILVI